MFSNVHVNYFLKFIWIYNRLISVLITWFYFIFMTLTMVDSCLFYKPIHTEVFLLALENWCRTLILLYDFSFNFLFTGCHISLLLLLLLWYILTLTKKSLLNLRGFHLRWINPWGQCAFTRLRHVHGSCSCSWLGGPLVHALFCYILPTEVELSRIYISYAYALSMMTFVSTVLIYEF